MYHVLHFACHFLCEMVMIDPMNFKIVMLKLDSWLDLFVLSLHFFHLWLLFYAHVNVAVTLCVTPLLVHLI